MGKYVSGVIRILKIQQCDSNESERQNNNRFIISKRTTLDMFRRNSTPAGFTYILQSKWVGKIEIKNESKFTFQVTFSLPSCRWTLKSPVIEQYAPSHKHP